MSSVRCVNCGLLMRKISGNAEECSVDDRGLFGWDLETRGVPICGEDHHRLDSEWEHQLRTYRGHPGATRWPVVEVICVNRECGDWCQLDITASAKEHKTMREAERALRESQQNTERQLQNHDGQLWWLRVYTLATLAMVILTGLGAWLSYLQR